MAKMIFVVFMMTGTMIAEEVIIRKPYPAADYEVVEVRRSGTVTQIGTARPLYRGSKVTVIQMQPTRQRLARLSP